ncbi:hypothetical protein Dsin_024431 [Dipteronia sinensis]|uniref:Endonuclease/exonuclease/phosphatase domain-containing protein n=1 Tax=Dipteronia sinensis TaxID=43782 RepID=A0AAD9ZU70_9ROSI|nr:hypothetical protein Dsin_024431 [Dipteronia sinensis]
MLVMTWNVRGLGNREKRRLVRSLVSKYRPVVFFIQETKLSSTDNGVLRSLGGSLLSTRVWVDDVRSVGGLVTLWDEELFLAKAYISNQRCIILMGELLKFKKDVVFCNVYTANMESERQELWEFLEISRNSFTMPWILGGDFNRVLDSSERKGGGGNVTSMKNFGSFISKMEVINIPLRGISFT